MDRIIIAYAQHEKVDPFMDADNFLSLGNDEWA